MPLRRLISILLAALCVTAAASAAARGPGLVHRGQLFTIRASVKPNDVCQASIHYADGSLQLGRMQITNSTRATWQMRVRSSAAFGVAHWKVSCGTKVRSSGSFVVVGALSSTGASDETPKVVVDKQGFSQRPDSFGNGSSVSWGLVLHNTSAKEDAQNVYVLVNFVAANGELLASQTQTVPLVPANGTYDLGNSMSLRTQVATTRLEVTVRVGAHQPKQAHTTPDFANVRIVASDTDPGWVGEVDGEIVNDTSTETLSNANLSIVITDSSGAVVGGGTASMFSPLPSGSRIVFLSQFGYSSIPIDHAANALISITPTYTAATA